LCLGNFISEFGVVKRLMDGAQSDARLVVHNVPVIDDGGSVTWSQNYALTDEEAARTARCLWKIKNDRWDRSFFGRDA
jgi:hypothetical protein